MTKKLLTTAIVLMASLAQAEVVINEVMADNGGSYPNAAGEAMDWLELYNPGATPVDLTGWRITDTVEDEWSKWKEIPAGTTVPAGGYLLLWGHNKDFPTPDDKKGFCGVTNGEVHVKLGLSSKGETITLAASEADYNATNFADQVTFGAQFADVSYGRDPGDTAKWLFFTNATPGAANGSDGLAKYPPEEEPGGDDDPGDVSGDTELETKLLKIGLPVVVIDTVGQEEPTFDVVSSPSNPNTKAIGNATKVPGRLRIKVGNETTYDSGEYEKKKSGMTVKVRGNSSALMSGKKPYKIKLQAAADLLCRGNDEKFEDKEWVLLTETGDLLNTVAFKVNELLGLQWTPSYRYVNVVMNGDYRGLYQLIEAESRNENCRIDVAEDGYLFEWDGYWWNEDVSFTTPGAGMGWTFKYPDSDDVTEEQVESLSNSIRRVENAIYGPYIDPAYKYTQYPALIDVESWAAWLLGHDIMGTWDAAGSNVYMTKYDDNPNTKIFMANMWDFNTCFMMQDEWPRIRGWNYFKFLIQSHNHAFNNAWMRKWRRLRGHLLDDIDKTLGEMETSGLAAAIDASRVLDGERWSGTRNLFADDRKTVEDWFSSRIAWIDAHIGEMATDPEVVINEVMADNGGSYTNADGNASDWIELYNAGAADADISGWRLCDSTTKKWSKWEELPEGTVVPAGGYLIVWADDFTGWTNGEVHVNLGFSSKGEEVALAIAEGEIVDSFAFGPQYPDVSFGRDPSDPEKLVYFKAPTPGAANGNDGIENGDSFNISINELMAENGGKFLNAAGEAMDWLELYNAGAANVDVSGWGFQDDLTKAWSKWKTLPEGAVVPAGGYLLVWGDNKDFNSFTGITNGEVHVNMGLSKKGEGLHLALTNGVGTVVRIDGFDFPKQAPDVSWGRTASDPDKFLYFTEPTPAAANGDDGRKALLFTIDFDSNGGSPVVSVTNDYDAAISAPESTRTGYAFGGWYETGAAEPFVFSTMPARDVALTARWTANSYSVVYDPNGGEGASVTNGATYDAEFEVGACGFARTGYAFAGWTREAATGMSPPQLADGEVVSNLTAETDGVVTLYAVWTANEYALVYAADNGTGESVETNLAYDAEHIVLANPFAKIGHSFVSWTNAAGVAYLPGDIVSNLTAEAGATVVWTAAWTANVYAVSFDSNGGTAVDPLVADYGAAISVPEAPARTGYAFAGWYESGAADPFVFSTMPARDVALTAHWTANSYLVVYDPNGGEGASVTNGATYDAPFEVGACGFAKTGYAFAGWTREAATGMSPPQLADGEVVSNLTAETDGVVTLYAVWTANEYALVYAADNGTDASVETNLTYDAEHIVLANSFAKIGHSFVSWTNAAGVAYLPGDIVSNLTAEAGATVAWTAAWTANVYTVSFDSNGGTAVDPLVADYGAAISAPTVPTRTGYAFGGWYETGAADPFVFSTMPARDVALTAYWTANSYLVVYDPNGGEGASVTNGATYDAPFEVGACGFAKTGYAFAGWTREAATGMSPPQLAYGEVVSNLTAETDGVVTLYAVWTANEYALVYAADNGTDASVETNLAYDAEHIVLANPFAKIGHSFVSWTNAAGVAYLPGQAVSNLTAEADATVVWTAAWTANSYSVAFDGNGATSGTMEPMDFAYDVEKALVSNVFVRLGYAFDGWVVGEDDSTVIDDGAMVKNLTDKDGGIVILHARWRSLGPTVGCEIADEYRTKADVGVIPVEVVNVDEAVKIAVKGLPGGVKFAAKDVVDRKTKAVTVQKNSIYGAPAKSGVYAATVTVTPTDRKSKMAPIVKGLLFVVRNPGEHIVLADCDAAQGSVKGMGVYAKDKKVTLKATAAQGWVFSGWYDGDALVSRLASYVLTMPERDVSLTARFVTAAEDKGSIALAVDGEAFSGKSGGTPLPRDVVVKQGMYVEWPVAASALSATTVKVSGLPGGLKFAAKDMKIAGTPKAASKVDKYGKVTPSKVKITVTTAGKQKLEYVLNVTVRGIPAEGTFNGGMVGSGASLTSGEDAASPLGGLVTLTVAKTGKLSGKYLADGKTWTLSAAGFDTWDDDDRMTATLTAKSGKAVKAMRLAYEGDYVCASLASGEDDASPLWEAWRNEWKTEPQKSLAATLKGRKVSVPVPVAESGDGTVELTVGANGVVTAKGTFDGLDGKPYSASCSTVLLLTETEGRYRVYLYFPPKVGKFGGWSGTVVLVL